MKPLYEARADFMRGLLAEALERSGGHPVAAARLLQISRSYFHKLLETYQLEIPNRRGRGNDAWRSLSH